MRSLGRVVLVAAVLAAGCGHRGREVSAADRARCDQFARRVAPRGSEPYRGIYDDCVHNIEQPVRGGG